MLHIKKHSLGDQHIFHRNYAVQKGVHDIFKVLEEKNCQPRICDLASCLSELKERSFFGQAKTEGIITTRRVLKEMLKGVLQAKLKGH